MICPKCNIIFNPDMGFHSCSIYDSIYDSIYKGFKMEEKSPKKGVKYDAGKSAVELIPYAAEKAIGDVLEMGRAKYGEANWAKGIEYSRLIAASKRHLGKFNAGIDVDEESGLSHIAHAAANLVFLLWMIENRPDMDNRWEKGVKK